MPTHDQSYDEMMAAIASHDAVQEPWHLEPPTDGHEEDDRERAWSSLIRECEWFVDKYGAAELLRCISECLREMKR